MWKIVGTSVQGTSHIANSTPCQDSSAFLPLLIREEPVTLIAISDGAGSAKHSKDGSTFVVRNWLEAAEEILSKSSENNEKTSIEIANFVRANLIESVQGKAGLIDDYACTLLTAIIFADRALFFQIGDGAWVYRSDADYACATWPYHGDFAGDTIFLTSKNAPDFYQTAVVEKLNLSQALRMDLSA